MLNLGKSAVFGNYKVIVDGQNFRIVNLKNGLLNKRVFSDRSEANAYARQLQYWYEKNHSPGGKARTARHNKKVVKAYHKARKNVVQ